jgi:hypothetical protein
MGDIGYVVSSLPRSGTKYISKVLDALGLNCGHEQHFVTHSATLIRPDWDYKWGDASWMSVPYLYAVPPGATVFHQVRNPIDVLNSNLPIGGYSYFRTWDIKAGLESDPLFGNPLPYMRFIWENTREWVWPDGQAEGPESPEEIQRLIHWWLNWNMWIEYATLQRSDIQYIRYRIEDLNEENWTLLQDIAKVIDPENTKEEEEVREVLRATSRTTNRHRTPNTRITTDMMPTAAKLLMYRYGYDPTQISTL